MSEEAMADADAGRGRDTGRATQPRGGAVLAPRRSPAKAGAVAVVFGAGTSAGRAVSLALAEEVSLVYCADLRASAAAATAAAIVVGGGRAVSQSVDVTERDEVAMLFGRVAAERGRVDVVCNVTSDRARCSLLDLSERSLEHTVLASVRGALSTCQVAGRAMAAQGGGTVVNVVGPSVGAGTVSSAAIVAITAELSRELADGGVEVHAVAIDGARDGAGDGVGATRVGGIGVGATGVGATGVGATGVGAIGIGAAVVRLTAAGLARLRSTPGVTAPVR